MDKKTSFLKEFALGIWYFILSPVILVVSLFYVVVGFFNFLVHNFVVVINFFCGKKGLPHTKEDELALKIMNEKYDRENGLTTVEQQPQPIQQPQPTYVQNNYYNQTPQPTPQPQPQPEIHEAIYGEIPEHPGAEADVIEQQPNDNGTEGGEF